MKTTLEISDDLYRRAEEQAFHDRREVKDLVNDGLRLILGADKPRSSRERALAALGEVRNHPPYAPGEVQAMIDQANLLRKQSWE